MRVLITGAAGFVGSHLADRLVGRGDYVVGVDNFLTGRKDNFPRGKAALFEGDITDRPRFYELANFAAPDLVIHCAASYSDPLKWHRDTDTNIAGTINATLAAQHHGARLVYFQTALPPISSYAISKIAGEQYIDLSRIPATVFRLANIYGPRNVSGPIPTFYKRLTSGQECTVTDTSRDLVYIDDLIDGVLTAIDNRLVGKYDMCSGHHRPILEIYETVRNNLSIGGPAGLVPPPPDDVKQMVLDPAPAWRTLRWKPRTELAYGVAQATEWYRKHGVADTYTHLALKG